MTAQGGKTENRHDFCYLIYDGTYYKIGRSNNPEERLKALKTGNPSCKLISYGDGIEEKQLHRIFGKFRVKGEWFQLQRKHVGLICRLLNNEENGRDLKDCSTLRSSFLRSKAYQNYTLSFGKYKGRKISEMTKPDEIKYLQWVLSWDRIAIDSPALYKNIKLLFDIINFDEKYSWYEGED